MAIIGFQDVWVAGSRFYFERNSGGGLVDLGTVSAATPSFETTTLELKDGDGGTMRTIDEVLTDISESYEVTVKNFNSENLALAFAANEPSAWTGSTALSEVSHTAEVGAGKFVKLKTTAGLAVYNCSAVSTVKHNTGSPTYVEDTDYKVTSLSRGIIEIMSGGSISDGDTIKVTTTSNSVSGTRLVYPQSAGVIKGTGYIFWGRENNAEQTVREFTCSLQTSGATIGMDDYSEFTLTANVIGDVTETTEKAGKLIHFIGAAPAGN